MSKIKKQLLLVIAVVSVSLINISFCGDQLNLEDQFSNYGVEGQTYISMHLDPDEPLASVACTILPENNFAHVLERVQENTSMRIENPRFTYPNGRSVPSHLLMEELVKTSGQHEKNLLTLHWRLRKQM